MKPKRFNSKNAKMFYCLFILLAVFNLQLAASEKISLFYNNESPKVKFAVDEVKQALKEKGKGTVDLPLPAISRLNQKAENFLFLDLGNKGNLKIIQDKKIGRTGELKNEGFIIHRSSKNDKTIWIIGYDEAGLMYGGLEIAEIIKVQGIDAIQNQLQNPYMKVRGTKFNIPLDVRTPTYTDPCDAAQNNMAEMWNVEFWKEYIDNLARYRYNLISLWNEHPFPSMVKVPEYPDIALNDVRKSTGKWQETLSLSGQGFDAPEIVNNYEVIKKITIDEKIDFWRKVMAYGKERNVKFYIVTWNIFVYGTEGKYGITDKLENPVTTDYFRKTVKQMVLTYPDLGGIGLTTGENMYDYSASQKEEWAYATYGQGVLDALKEQPDRKIDFIHRQHQATASEITRIFKGIADNKNINFLFSFKYAQAHVYSSTQQPFHENFVKDIQSENMKTLWTLRNDDVFYFRWGAPDFVREFIKNMPYDISEGYYYGSDQYVWGRDFLTKDSSEPLNIEIVKHWYQWMCWGRLGYNPNMGNDRFVNIIQSRFPSVNAQEMFNAWQSASMIYPLVTGFHWLDLDFQWYIEGGKSQPFVVNTPSGYNDVNSFINVAPHKKSGNISIPEYVKAYISKAEMKGTTPLQVAENIIKNADIALNWAEKQSTGNSQELRYSVEDIKSMAWLGKYYAHKILAATYLALFRETSQKDWHKKTIDELNLSASYWRHFAAISLSNYKNPLWTNRVGIVDWKVAFKYALYEITSNNGKVNLASMQPTIGGTILEAEDTDLAPELKMSKINGFTGKGYVVYQQGMSAGNMIWKYNAPEAGKYILEFRYSLKREEATPSFIEINGEKFGDIDFWSTGNEEVWLWERVTVNLKKGENTIRLFAGRFANIDHVNIIKN